MEKINNILILRRDDLVMFATEKSILEIEETDFRLSIVPFREAGVFIFIDNDLSVRVLKNRYE